jgi:hypothetical protein
MFCPEPHALRGAAFPAFLLSTSRLIANDGWRGRAANRVDRNDAIGAAGGGFGEGKTHCCERLGWGIAVKQILKQRPTVAILRLLRNLGNALPILLNFEKGKAAFRVGLA